MNLRFASTLFALALSAWQPAHAATEVPAAEVPAEFLGDWVPARASCQSPLRLRVAADTLTLIRGAQRAEFGKLEVCHSCEGGARYTGIVVWLSPTATDPAPFVVRFNDGEKPGRTRVEFLDRKLGHAYPLDRHALRRCGQNAVTK